MQNEQKNELTIMEWNLHGKCGLEKKKGNIVRNYVFPVELITKNIERIDPDIIVFTEFVSFRFEEKWDDKGKDNPVNVNEDAKELKKWLEDNKYDLFYTPFSEEGIQNQFWNGVGIAVKNEKIKAESKYNVDYRKDNNEIMPDHLTVSCSMFDNNLSKNIEFDVIGVRIRPMKNTNKMYEQLKNMLKKREEMSDFKEFIMIGDFNNGSRNNKSENSYEKIKEQVLSRKWNIYSPGVSIRDNDIIYNKLVFSYVRGEYISMLDHMITSFEAIEDVNDIGYDWKFMDDVYSNLGNFTNGESLRNIPDHAILYAKVNLDNLKK